MRCISFFTLIISKECLSSFRNTDVLTYDEILTLYTSFSHPADLSNVMSLVEKGADGRNFIVPSYTRTPA